MTHALPDPLHSFRGYQLNADVFLKVDDGLGRILDFERGGFFGLDEIATQMLSRTLDAGPDAAATEIAGRFDAPLDEVRNDLAELLTDLELRGIVCSAPGGGCGAADGSKFSSLSSRPVSALLGCLLRIVTSRSRRRIAAGQNPRRWCVNMVFTLTWLSLRLFGWRQTLDLFRQTHRDRAGVDGIDRAAILDATDRIVRDTAARRVLLPMVCKERAIAAHQMLRGFHGLPSVVVAGCQQHPFGAHAWVECDGRILTDDPEHCRTFEAVARYA